MKKNLIALMVLALASAACAKKHKHAKPEAAKPAQQTQDQTDTSGKASEDSKADTTKAKADYKDMLESGAMFGACEKLNTNFAQQPPYKSTRLKMEFVNNLVTKSRLTFEGGYCQGKVTHTDLLLAQDYKVWSVDGRSAVLNLSAIETTPMGSWKINHLENGDFQVIPFEMNGKIGEQEDYSR